MSNPQKKSLQDLYKQIFKIRVLGFPLLLLVGILILGGLTTLFLMLLSNDNKAQITNGSEIYDAVITLTPTPQITITPTLTPTSPPSPTPVPTEDLTGKAIDPLTGLYIPIEETLLRPVAVVFNNHHKALPQSGLGQAALYYEVLAEGNITRIIAIFHSFNSQKIGPVRSTRHYFNDFALDYDAIFIHHGGSPQGYSSIKNLRVANIDGMAVEGITFWRDPIRSKQSSMYEHSSYTNAEKIQEAIANYNYRKNLADDWRAGFSFQDKDAINQYIPEDQKPAKSIFIGYSDAYTSTFIYHPLENKYYKFHEDEAHIDEEIGEQLYVTNVLIQFTNIYEIAGDSAGRREVETLGSGEGFFISNGVCMPIIWNKSSHNEPTQWKFANGEKLLLNPGKTWICVVSPNTNFKIE